MADTPFILHSSFAPMGDQPRAIDELTDGVVSGRTHQVLLGATGTGKTFTIANVINRVNRPTLIVSHNKTLAAQLYEEMKELFPQNAVSYFVSYFDYYQPEAYIPQRDIYIEKDSARNADLDRLRLAATCQLLTRRDTIVVSSVSCLYGLGAPSAYRNKILAVERGVALDRRAFLLGLSAMQYTRNEVAPERGNFRVRGDCIEVYPAYEKYAIRIDLFGDTVDTIELFDPLTGEVLAQEQKTYIFPAVHHVMPEEQKATALASIREELDARVLQLRSEGKLLETQRLISRTRHDLELLEETGFCGGIENYSRHFDGRVEGERAWTLLDYFRACPNSPAADPENDWLVVVDESHVTLPQIRGMYFGDRARKQTLVDHGFRLPSALDNRPLRFDEFCALSPQSIYVSATPAPWELEASGGLIVEQVIRPTGLVDPPIEIRPARTQVPDLMVEARARAAKGERTLVTALTKRLCEDLTGYLDREGLRVRYLHSDIETLQRLELLRDLREGAFDVLVGVNLLREGLDLPEVSLVCILDADKQGFLRSQSALIQTMGRAARNANSLALLYAQEVTPDMQRAIDEVTRRRTKQLAYNAEHGIVPTTIQKAIRRGIELELAAHRTAQTAAGGVREGTDRKDDDGDSEFDLVERIMLIEGEMLEAAERLEFEKAARLRDEVTALKTRAARAQSDEPSVSARSGSKSSQSSNPSKPSKAGMPGTRGRKGSSGRKRNG